MRWLRWILVFPFLTAPVLAQCEVDRLDPSGPIQALGYSGGFADGIAAVPGWDRVAVFERATNGWQEAASFVSEGEFIFGPVVVATGGGTIVTGAPEAGDTIFEGRAYVYEAADGWSTAYELSGSNPGPGDVFGSELAIVGDTLVVGAPQCLAGGGCGPGKAYVFERQGSDWVETAVLQPHGFTDPDDDYGYQIATDGDTIVVGASKDDERGFRAGAVYVYVRTGTGWAEEAKLFASDVRPRLELGASVAYEDGTLLVGADRFEFAGPQALGAVYVFERTATGWLETQVLTARRPQVGDHFGASVALSGDRAVVGAPSFDGSGVNVGAIYGFERGASGWTEAFQIVADDADAYSWFGAGVYIDGNEVLWHGYFSRHARVHSLSVGPVVRYCVSGANSTGSPAVVGAVGCNSVGGNALTLRATSVPPGELGVFVFGEGPNQVPLGNGFLCVATPLYRSRTAVADGGGTLATTLDFEGEPASVITPGSTWYFQAIFRDTGAGAALDSSDGIALLLGP